MHQEYVQNIRADLDYLNLKISHLSGNRNEVHSACKRLEKNVNHLNQMLVKERMAFAEEREKMEEAIKLERGAWKAKEMCLVSHIKTLKTDLKIQDLLVNRTRKTSLSGVRADSSKDRGTEEMMKAVKDLKKERLENNRIRAKNDAAVQHIQKLEEANQQLNDELTEKDEAIEKLMQKWKASKMKVEKIRKMSDELRSRNEEVHSRYRAMLKQKMEKLEREREMIRDPVNELEKVIKEREDRFLSALPSMVMGKQRLMQELKEKCLRASETMSKEESKEWKKMPRKRENEAEREMKAEEKRRKELLKAEQKVENKKEKKSFWRRLQCWRK